MNNNNDELINDHIYIDLDVILDTRLGLLKSIDKKLVNKVFEKDYYESRYYDEFDYICNNLFIKLYNKRDKHVLRLSGLSKILYLLLKEIDLLHNKLVTSGTSNIVYLDINVYPYILDESELEYIGIIIKNLMVIDSVMINVFYKDDKDITLKDVGYYYNVMFKYNSSVWLDYHLHDLTADAIYVKLYGPALIFNGIALNKKISLENLLQMQTELYKPYINYTALGVEYFCENKKYGIVT